MNDWTPGDGWRMEQFKDEVPNDTVAYREADGSWSYWVREEPVPALPTEPWTLIRAWWGTEANTLLLLHENGEWRSELDSIYDRDDLAQMTRFEVLAEPCHAHYGHEDLEKTRRDTAKEVLGALEEFFDTAWTPGYERLFSYDHQRRLFDRLRTKFGIGAVS